MVGKQLIVNLIQQIGTKLHTDYVHKEDGKALSTNDLTDELVNKINTTHNYDDTEIKSSILNLQQNKANISDMNNLLAGKVDKEANKSLISNTDLLQINTNKNNIISLQNTKANINEVYNKVDINSLLSNKVDKETNKSLISQSDLAQINTNKNNILMRSLITETGSQIQLTIDNNYNLSAILKDKNGNVIYVSNNIEIPLNTKVDKVAGKALSTNDFTNEYKDKVDTIEDISAQEINEIIEESFKEV